MSLVLGLDLGTSGLRAALVDAAREPVAFVSVPIAPARRRDPHDWWEAVRQAVALLGGRADLARVGAVAVDGTSGTILPIDRQGRPVAVASLYNEAAAAGHVAAVAAVAAEDSAARGATSPLARLLGFVGIADLARVVHEADWITGRLCGRFDTSDANNALKTGYDPRDGAWPGWVLALVGRDLLPAVVPPGAALGTVRPDVAEELGLPAGAIVAAGTTDGCAAFLATGASRPGDAVTSLGSTLTVKLLSDVPVFAPRYGIYSHLVLGRWLAGGASNSGGAALRRHFDADALDRLSTGIDPAVDTGLDYYPLPGTGERFPVADPAMQARETPRPPDDAAFLHGLLAGIARIEALGYRRLEELGATRVGSVRTVGGGAGNAAWTAIRTRLLPAEMRRARSQEAAVGTAGLALAALGA